MKNRKINKTFYSYILPSILAFALSGIYTIVDGFFIGNKLGDDGIAAITIAFPIAAFIQALGTGIGMAGGINYSILKCDNDRNKQFKCFTITAILLLIFSIILTISFFFSANLLMKLFGAQGNVCEMATQYIKVVALGATFQIFATGFVPFMRNMNGASVAMIAMMCGFFTNIVLDYLFVFEIPLKMIGAALATVIGQAITLLIAIIFLLTKKIKLCKCKLKEITYLSKDMLKIALSPFGLTFSPTLTLILMSKFLLIYGNSNDVAIFGCIDYVLSVIYMLLQGVGDGSQPLISMYYGENDKESLSTVKRKTYVFGEALTIVCIALVFIFRKQIGILFGASNEVNNDVIKYIPYFLSSLLFLCYSKISSSYFYATKNAKLSYLLVYAEPVLVLLMLIILPIFLNILGVWIAIPIAQTIAFVIALIIRIVLVKKKNVNQKATI